MRGWLVCCLMWLVCDVAQAEVIAMLSVKRDPQTSERDEWAVTHAITDFFAERDMPVVLPSQARERLGDDHVPCQLPACAPDYLDSLQADLAVGSVVFAEGGELQAVNIAVIRPDGLAFTGSIPVDPRGIDAAAQEAVALAWERFMRGPGPWLEIRGTTGYRVLLDGELAGSLPYRERIKPGVHQLRVETPDGTAHYEATLNVPDDPAQYTHVDASRSNRARPPAGAQALSQPENKTPPAPPEPVASPYNYVAGGLLVAAGATVLTPGVLAMVKDGQCVGGGSPPPGPDTCQAYQGGATATALTVGGAVLTAAGITWLAWRPLKHRPDVRASLRGTQLIVEGTF